MKRLALGLLLGGIVLGCTSISYVNAEQGSSTGGNNGNKTVQDLVDSAYSKPSYVLGYSLSEDQRNFVLDKLQFDKSKDSYIELKPQGYTDVMNEEFIPTRQLYSSVKIQKLSEDKPLEVDILTPDNITMVTEDMYRNASLTVGLEHAKIEVASPIAVSGESALAGVYYSMREKGVDIQSGNVEVANDEIHTLSKINEENKGKEGFNPEVLNVALMDIKKQIAELSADERNKENIEKIVKLALDNYKIGGVITPNQAMMLVDYGMKLSSADVINNENFVNSLNQVKNDVVNKSKDLFKGINTDKLKEKSNGLWEKIKSFFISIGQFFQNLVSGDKN